jgi:hypothetical protein
LLYPQTLFDLCKTKLSENGGFDLLQELEDFNLEKEWDILEGVESDNPKTNISVYLKRIITMAKSLRFLFTS